MSLDSEQRFTIRNYIQNNYDILELFISPKGKLEMIDSYAQLQGENLNTFINRAIDEAMQRDEEK